MKSYKQPEPKILKRELERYKRDYQKYFTDNSSFGCYLRHRILEGSLRFYSDLKGWGYLEPKEMLKRLEKEDKTGTRIYHTALKYSDKMCLRDWIDYLDTAYREYEKQVQMKEFDEYWMNVQIMLSRLRCEAYIDDQLEIEEIWMATEAYIKTGNPEMVTLESKIEVLDEILENDYYDYYGVADPMMDLIRVLFKKKEEKKIWAELLEKHMYLRKAAEIYLELQELDKYENLLDRFLGKELADYVKLMEFCDSIGKHEKAVKTAEAALERCRREDFTRGGCFLWRMLSGHGTM